VPQLQILLDSSFSKLFLQAESAVKDVEISHQELIIPAINELRYAGYHIANLVSNPDLADELTKAENHCKRSIYDAYEAHILFLVAEIKTFKEDYRNTLINNIVPKYTEYQAKVKEIISFVQVTDKETKNEHYIKCREYSQQLKEIVTSLDGAREELNKQIKLERRKSQLVIAGLVLVVLSSIVATIVACICK